MKPTFQIRYTAALVYADPAFKEALNQIGRTVSCFWNIQDAVYGFSWRLPLPLRYVHLALCDQYVMKGEMHIEIA